MHGVGVSYRATTQPLAHSAHSWSSNPSPSRARPSRSPYSIPDRGAPPFPRIINNLLFLPFLQAPTSFVNYYGIPRKWDPMVPGFRFLKFLDFENATLPTPVAYILEKWDPLYVYACAYTPWAHLRVDRARTPMRRPTHAHTWPKSIYHNGLGHAYHHG